MENEWRVCGRLFCKHFECKNITILALKCTFQIENGQNLGEISKRQDSVCSFALLYGGLVKDVIVYLLSVIICSREEKQMLVIYILFYEACFLFYLF